MPHRLTLLLAVHLVLGVAPAARSLQPADSHWIPLSWVLTSISLGQLILLSFWAAMSASTVMRRLAASFAGLLYLTTWPTAAFAMSPNTESPLPALFAIAFVVFAALFAVSAGVYLSIRRRVAELRHVDEPDASSPAGFHFSVASLFLITLVAAIVAGVMRIGMGDVPSVVSVWLSRVVFFIGLIVNLIAAPWAALAPGRVRWRVALTALIGVILGAAMSFTVFRHWVPELRLWFLATQSLAFAIPPLIVVASLLVVRSCGFRLLHKPTAGPLGVA